MDLVGHIETSKMALPDCLDENHFKKQRSRIGHNDKLEPYFQREQFQQARDAFPFGLFPFGAGPFGPRQDWTPTQPIADDRFSPTAGVRRWGSGISLAGAVDDDAAVRVGRHVLIPQDGPVADPLPPPPPRPSWHPS